MNILLVTAHPLTDSLCHHLAQKAAAALEAAGHEVVNENLYQSGFDPTLTAVERESYYSDPYDGSAVRQEVERLLAADAMVLVFPTWWFGFPAMLKGWFDRVWGPGISYDHADDLGPIRPRLDRLQRMAAITTLGAPWWVDRLVMRQPVKKVLGIALLKACAPHCRFSMLSLYKSEALPPHRVERFVKRIETTLKGW